MSIQIGTSADLFFPHRKIPHATASLALPPGTDLEFTYTLGAPQ